MSRDELNQLLNVVLPAAHQMLDEQGEFYPYAAAVQSDGEIRLIMGHPGQENPSSSDLFEFLARGLRETAAREGYRAIAICSDVRMRARDRQESSDAICVFLEDKEGEAVNVYEPYERQASGGYSYRELIATAAKPGVFGGQDRGRDK